MTIAALYRWINGASWRWRLLAHFPIGVASGRLHPILGTLVAIWYYIHERLQAARFGRWRDSNTKDLLSAYAGVAIGLLLWWAR